jgi:uncharacterized membrane protein
MVVLVVVKVVLVVVMVVLVVVMAVLVVVMAVLVGKQYLDYNNYSSIRGNSRSS